MTERQGAATGLEDRTEEQLKERLRLIWALRGPQESRPGNLLWNMTNEELEERRNLMLENMTNEELHERIRILDDIIDDETP